MMIPNRFEVTRAFTEPEAFLHADKLYSDWITRNTPPQSADIVGDREAMVFRPALELQLAGLCLLGDTDMDSPTNQVAAFFCFTVDHLLWGWFAAVNCHPRIAFSLVRSALEASIFAIAAKTDYARFKSIWNSRDGTGGKVLNRLKGIPDDLRWLLHSAWQLMVKLGHASDGPVLSAMTTFAEGEERKAGITFAGQFAGPLDGRQLIGCADAFCIAAIASVEAMAICLAPLFKTSVEWLRRFGEFQRKMDTRVPIPDEMVTYYSEHMKRFGERPRR